MQEIRTKVQLLVNTGCNPMATHNHECRKGQRFAICNRIMDKNNKACKTLSPKKVWLEQGCILSLSLLTTTLHGMKVTKNVNCLMSPGNPHDSTHSTCSACSSLDSCFCMCYYACFWLKTLRSSLPCWLPCGMMSNSILKSAFRGCLSHLLLKIA